MGHEPATFIDSKETGYIGERRNIELASGAEGYLSFPISILPLFYSNGCLNWAFGQPPLAIRCDGVTRLWLMGYQQK